MAVANEDEVRGDSGYGAEPVVQAFVVDETPHEEHQRCADSCAQPGNLPREHSMPHDRREVNALWDDAAPERDPAEIR